MKNDDRRAGSTPNRSGGASRRSYGQGRSGAPRTGAIYSGVPAARRADAANGDERPAEYRGNGYRSGSREATSARTYERGGAGYDRDEANSARRNREANHTHRDTAGNGYRSGSRESAPARTYERGGAGYDRSEANSARQSRESNHTRRDDAAGNFGASDRQWGDRQQREFSETSREKNAPLRAERDMTPGHAEGYSAAASLEGYSREPSIPPEENENLLAGRNPIREALKSGRSVEKLLVAKGDLSGAARDLVRMAKEAGAVVQEVDRSRLDAIYPAHQGLLAYVAAVDYASVDDLFARAEERGEEPFFILLDGVTDPHNLGAILRTAECAGAHGAILPERRSAGLGPAAAKAAAGALDCLPVARVKNLNRTIDELKQRGVWIIGTAMEGEDALSADLSGAVALVIGSEGEGVSRLTLEKCDRTLTLPMRGRIESLNASVAAGILMYEVVRARAK